MSKITVDQMTRAINEGHFGSSRALKPADPIAPTPMVLPVEQIQEYDRNPRREKNTAYEAIKEALRHRGFSGALPITRRPGETHYMVAEGGNTTLQILKELHEETQDPRFFEVHCLFELWVSESNTLLAHLIENDARGDLIFIDRARAVRELRSLLEEETQSQLSQRQLSALLAERGYRIDQSLISRMDYAMETLLPVIPQALRAGAGRPQVDRIRGTETALIQFLTHRDYDREAIEKVRLWFLQCLARFDSANWHLDPVKRHLFEHLAEICDEDLGRVQADFNAIANTGEPGPTAPESAASLGQRDKEGQGEIEQTEAFQTSEPLTSSTEKASFPERNAPLETLTEAPESPQTTPLPQDLKSLRARMWTLSTQLAQRAGLDQCVLSCKGGCGYLMDLPMAPLVTDAVPKTPQETKRITLWWFLAGLCEQWLGDYAHDNPPLSILPQATRIRPAIEALAAGNEEAAQGAITALVSGPPSFDLMARHGLACLDETEFRLVTALLETRRALHAACVAQSKAVIWELT